MLDIRTNTKTLYQTDNYLGDFIITIDGESVTYTSADIKAGTLEITESLCSGGSVNFGAVEKEQLKATFGNLTQTKEELKGKKITIVQMVDGESVPLGVFTIDDSQNDGDYFIKIVAYDDMVKLDEDISTWWNSLVSFPITVKNLLISLFGYLNIQYTLPSTFTNSNLLINRDEEFENVTGAQIVGWIQEIIGAFVKPDRYGKMRLIELPSTSDWQDSTPSVTYRTNTDNRTTLILSDIEIADYVVEPITGVQIRDTSEDVGVRYGTTDNMYVIQANPFLANLDTATGVPIAQTIFNKIRYLSYRPFKGTFKGLPYIECGDVIAVETIQGKHAVAPMLYRKLHSGGLYKDLIEVSGTEKHENVVTIQSSIKALNRTTHTVINTLETFQSTITSMGQTLDHAVIGETYYWLVNDGETPSVDDLHWTTDSSVEWEIGKSKWQKVVTHYVGREDSIRIVNMTEPNMIDIETWYYLSISETELIDDYIYFTDHTFFSEKLYFVTPLGKGWVKNKKPEAIPGHYLWTKFKKIFSDGTTVWTDPIVDTDFNNAYTLIYQNTTSIEQTNDAIRLKADSTYVKEQYNTLNAKIEQETSERHAEIAETAQSINISVNQKVSAKPNRIDIMRIAVDAGIIPTTDMEGWTTGTVVKGTGQHIWEIVKTTRIDVEDPTQEIVTYTGLADITGEKGEPGDNAAAVEVYDQKIRYAASNSGTVIPSSSSSWKNDIASTGITAQQYLWTWTWIQWAHKNDLGNWVMDSDTNSYSVSYWSKDGVDGINGTNGIDGRGIVSVVKKYKTSTSRTDPYASGYTYFEQDTRFNTRSYFTELNHADDTWSDDIPEQFTPGRYLWTWTRTTWTDGTVTDEYTCDPSVAASYDIYAYAEADIMVAEDNIRLWANRVETLTTDFNTYKTETDSKIEVMPNQILSQVSETYQTKNDMAQYSTTTQMNSAITQRANSIMTTVSQTYQTIDDMTGYTRDESIISSINQSAEEIKIQANKLNLVGAVKIRSEDTDNLDNIVEINNGTLRTYDRNGWKGIEVHEQFITFYSWKTTGVAVGVAGVTETETTKNITLFAKPNCRVSIGREVPGEGVYSFFLGNTDGTFLLNGITSYNSLGLRISSAGALTLYSSADTRHSVNMSLTFTESDEIRMWHGDTIRLRITSNTSSMLSPTGNASLQVGNSTINGYITNTDTDALESRLSMGSNSATLYAKGRTDYIDVSDTNGVIIRRNSKLRFWTDPSSTNIYSPDGTSEILAVFDDYVKLNKGYVNYGGYLDNFNNAPTHGMYHYNSSTANIPSGLDNWGLIWNLCTSASGAWTRNDSTANGWAFQIAWSTTNKFAIRALTKDGYTAWKIW